MDPRSPAPAVVSRIVSPAGEDVPVASREVSPPLLEVRGIAKPFGRSEVLRGVDLSLWRGERLALIGPNGAGKSTLFDIISGRLRPSAGRVMLNGVRIDGRSPQRIARLGLARSFQASRLFGRLSVHDNLRAAAMWSSGAGYRIFGATAAQRRADAVAAHWLARLGLQACGGQPAAQLAYADQRLLDIGLALASGAELLLLDEPTAGMSRSESERCVALLRDASAGRTLLVVEHDMGVVFELAQRIAVLERGKLLAVGTPAAVRADARVQAAYLGSIDPVGAGGGVSARSVDRPVSAARAG